MTEAGSYTPEVVQKALGLIAPDVSAELKFKSTETDAFYVMGASLGVDAADVDAYQDAREASGLLRGRGKNKVPEMLDKVANQPENKLAIGIVRLLNEGNETGYVLLQKMYEEKNYEGLVRVAAALNQLAITNAEDPAMANPNMAQQAAQDSSGGDRDMFGDLSMTALMVRKIKEQLPKLLSAAFKDTAPAGSEKKWGFPPVQEHLPDGYEFSLPRGEDLDKPEHALVQKLNREHIFVVDMLTRSGYFFQLQRQVLNSISSWGMHLKDLIGTLPGALQSITRFSAELNGKTEKEGDRIGESAPKPIEIESLMQAFKRELGVKATDAKGVEHLIWVPMGTADHLDVLSGNTAEHEVEEQPRFIDHRYNKKGEHTGYDEGRPFTLSELFLDTSRVMPGNKERNLEERVRTLAEANGPKTRWKVGDGADEKDFDVLLENYKTGGGRKQDRFNALMAAVRDKKIFNMNEKTTMYRLPDGSMVDMGEVFFTDMSENDRMAIRETGEMVMGEGAPLYTHPKIKNGERFFWIELSDAEKDVFETQEGGKLLSTSTLGAWHAEVDQFNLSNQNSNMWGTLPNAPRAYHGKSFFYDAVRQDIEKQLEQRGLTWANVTGFENDMADGNIADVDHERVNEIYDARGGDAGGDTAKEARAKYMLMEMVYVRYGPMINAALDIADLTQLSVQHDVAQLADNLAELWIKGLAKESYVEKYRMFLATHRNAIQTFIKPLLWWKSDYIDPVVASLKGDVLHSAHRDYLNPDNTPAAPILLTKDGKHLTDQQKDVVTALFYDKTDHILNWGPRVGLVNYIRQQAEALAKAATEADRLVIVEAMETFTRNTTKRVIDSFGSKTSSPQGFPRSRNDALSFANGISVEQRALLENVDFKALLGHLGYKHMNLEQGEYEGWRGATKLVEVRSMKHFQFGKLEDKLFKYMGKYPGMAVGAAHTIDTLFKSITQAEPTWMSKYLGGKPEGLGGFTADSALEGIITGALDWTLFFNKRTAKEAHEYISGIVEVIGEAQEGVGFHDQLTVRTFAANLLMWAMKRSELVDELPNYEFEGGGGEPGTARKRVEVDLVPHLKPGHTQDELRVWAKNTMTTIETYRQAGCRVIFPYKSDMQDFNTWAANTPAFDKTLLEPTNGGDLEETMRFGKLRMEAYRLGYKKIPNAYVVVANSPVYKIPVDLDPNDSTKVVMQKMTGTGQTIYGHLGGEPLMLAIMVKMAQDKNIITEMDAAELYNITRKMMKEKSWYKDSINKWMKGGYLTADGETMDYELIMADIERMRKESIKK